jgi:hypothetical protein
LLAGGLAAGPVIASALARAGIWWSLPILLAILLVVETLLSRCLPRTDRGAVIRPSRRRVPARFRAYPALVLAYAICVIICVTWPRPASGNAPSVQLKFTVLVEGAFWAALVVFGRVLFAYMDGRKSWRVASIVPFLLIAAVILAGLLLPRYGLAQVGSYLLAALACAALLPLNVRPGAEHLAVLPLAVTGGIAAMFPIWIGLARPGYQGLQRGMSSLGIFITLAALGATVSLLLWPIMSRWPALAVPTKETPAAYRRPSAGRLRTAITRTARPIARQEPPGAGVFRGWKRSPLESVQCESRSRRRPGSSGLRWRSSWQVTATKYSGWCAGRLLTRRSCAGTRLRRTAA